MNPYIVVIMEGSKEYYYGGKSADGRYAQWVRDKAKAKIFTDDSGIEIAEGNSGLCETVEVLLKPTLTDELLQKFREVVLAVNETLRKTEDISTVLDFLYHAVPEDALEEFSNNIQDSLDPAFRCPK